MADNGVIEENSLEIIPLIIKVWRNRKRIYKIVGLGIIISLIIAFSIPPEYTTVVQLAPEISDVNAKGNLGGIAAAAGISMTTNTNTDAFSHELYPDIIKSTPFCLDLLTIQVKTKKGDFNSSLFDYLNDSQNYSWWVYVFKFPFKIIKWMKELIIPKEEKMDLVIQDNIYSLSKDQYEVIKNLRERVNVDIDKKNYIISINVQMQDPLVAAQIADIVLVKIQAYISDYRTQKAKQDLEFSEIIFKEVQSKYYKTQNNYANFEDSNKNIATASYLAEKERLRNEMSLAFGVYTSLAQKVEHNKMRVQEQTPVYAVLEPSKIAIKPSSPKKMFILLGFIFLSLIIGCSLILFEDEFKKLRNSL